MNLQFLPVVYLGGWKKKTNTTANTEWENLAGQGNKIINKRIQSDHRSQPLMFPFAKSHNPFSLPSTPSLLWIFTSTLFASSNLARFSWPFPTDWEKHGFQVTQDILIHLSFRPWKDDLQQLWYSVLALYVAMIWNNVVHNAMLIALKIIIIYLWIVQSVTGQVWFQVLKFFFPQVDPFQEAIIIIVS